MILGCLSIRSPPRTPRVWFPTVSGLRVTENTAWTLGAEEISPPQAHTHMALWGLSVTCWLKKVFTTGFQMILPWYTDTSTLHKYISLPTFLEGAMAFWFRIQGEKTSVKADTLKILLNWKMKLLSFYFLVHRQKESSSVDWEINSDCKGKESYCSIIGAGNGNPLQCSCLENPRDGGARWAAVYGVAQSRTRLMRLSSSSSNRAERGCLGLPLQTLWPCWKSVQEMLVTLHKQSHYALRSLGNENLGHLHQ